MLSSSRFKFAVAAAAEPDLRRRLVEEDRRALYESGALDAFPDFRSRFERFLEMLR